jgi:enamine deaminase RidA (YjgF/YER057c/UK114 family)
MNNDVSNIENKLNKLGLVLVNPKLPVGQYLDCKRSGNLLFVSGRVSELVGEVGTDVTLEEAKEAARNTVVLLLSILKKHTGNLDEISGVLKLQGFIRSSSQFTKHPQVLDGASELLIELFGENGHHARTATGVAQLPFGASVQLDLILVLKQTEK